MWTNLRENLCRDNPRFECCSCRLLKEHMLEQVRKFKKYSEEATESEVERLSTPWGLKMQALMAVWANYEALVESELPHKVINKGGRPRKIIPNIEADIQLCAEIREAALQYQLLSQNEDHVQIYMKDTDEMETENIASPQSTSHSTTPEPIHTQSLQKPNQTTRKRKVCNSDFLEYLIERNKIKERQLELEERKFVEESELNERKMKLEEKKVEALLKEKQANIEREKATTKVLLMILDNPSIQQTINDLKFK
ncbi:hypothetical protein CHUAL_008103 [Chamberlinius hualienensis]